VVAALRDVVDELAGLDPTELSDPALASELLALRAQIDRLDGVFARLTAASHQRGLGAMDGAASTAAWLREQAGMREGEARAAIEAGETAELLAETGAAWRDGAISSGAAKTIFGARVDGHDDQLRASEPVLLDLARRNDLRSLRRASAHFRKLALADGTEPGARNGVYLSRTYDGVTVLNGELEDIAAETVLTAIHAFTDPPSDDDHRTPAQRRAAALVRICERALAHIADDRRPSAQVSVVIDWTTLTNGQPGRHDGAFTGPIHPRDLERLLCDCTVSRIVTGPDSLPIDVGRSRRTIPPAIRRAVLARDGGCRFPGCDRPTGWCQIHHTRPWMHGGCTAVGELVALCDHHHHVIHLPGWIVTFDGRELIVIRPDGTELRESLPVSGGRLLSAAAP
jgi:hypothetical protein